MILPLAMLESPGAVPTVSRYSATDAPLLVHSKVALPPTRVDPGGGLVISGADRFAGTVYAASTCAYCPPEK